MKKILLAILIAVQCYGCGNTPSEESQTGSIYGVITDKATGEPVRAAGVLLNPVGTTAITGDEGQYEFLGLEPGGYTIQVTKTGYADLTGHQITVVGGKTNKGDVQLQLLPPSLRVTNNDKQDIVELDFGDAEADVSRSFNIFNDGVATLEWEITETSEWITKLSRENGALSAGATHAVIITIDREKLSSGANSTTIHVTSNNGSKQLSVKATNNSSRASLNTLDVSNISASSATFNGKITSAGRPSNTERGFVYSQSSMPTLESSIAKLTAPVTSTTEYSANATGLTLGTKYYVRAYAINSAGTAYSSNEVSFVPNGTAPTLSTQDVTNINIGAGTATFNGTILTVGDPAYTERGFVYGKTHNPTISDNKRVASGAGTGAFSLNVTGIQEGSTYYVRSYATNASGTTYGAEVSLNFNGILPAVSTQATTNIDVGTTMNIATAVFNGTILNSGDPAYTEKGFVYGRIPNPTIDDTKKVVSGGGTGSFTANITGLTVQTTYYVRTYVIHSSGIIYGEQVSFSAESSQYYILSLGDIMVQKQDISSSQLGWATGNTMCESSVVAGYDDWRLPTINELLIIYSMNNLIGSFKTAIQYSGVHPRRPMYWSSEYYGEWWDNSKGTDAYKGVRFSDGIEDRGQIDATSNGHNWNMNSYYATDHYARCVRTLP